MAKNKVIIENLKGEMFERSVRKTHKGDFILIKGKRHFRKSKAQFGELYFIKYERERGKRSLSRLT